MDKNMMQAKVFAEGCLPQGEEAVGFLVARHKVPFWLGLVTDGISDYFGYNGRIFAIAFSEQSIVLVATERSFRFDVKQHWVYPISAIYYEPRYLLHRLIFSMENGKKAELHVSNAGVNKPGIIALQQLLAGKEK